MQIFVLSRTCHKDEACSIILTYLAAFVNNHNLFVNPILGHGANVSGADARG